MEPNLNWVNSLFLFDSIPHCRVYNCAFTVNISFGKHLQRYINHHKHSMGSIPWLELLIYGLSSEQYYSQSWNMKIPEFYYYSRKSHFNKIVGRTFNLMIFFMVHCSGMTSLENIKNFFHTLYTNPHRMYSIEKEYQFIKFFSHFSYSQL